MVFTLKCPSDNHGITMAGVQNCGTLEVVWFLKITVLQQYMYKKNMKYKCTIFAITVENSYFWFLYFYLYLY